MIASPHSLEALLTRCHAISGHALGDIAKALPVSIPKDLKNAKGWVGQLLEMALGASAGSQALPDFPELGIELKTIPLGANGAPCESTYVCTAPSPGSRAGLWKDSWVFNKLKRVLWVPVEADPSIPVKDRILGSPVLWDMPKEIEAVLQDDWTELTNQIQFGDSASITAHQGHYLQIRPKAMHSRIMQPVINSEGELLYTTPKGFYLRVAFTKQMLKETVWNIN